MQNSSCTASWKHVNWAFCMHICRKQLSLKHWQFEQNLHASKQRCSFLCWIYSHLETSHLSQSINIFSYNLCKVNLLGFLISELSILSIYLKMPKIKFHIKSVLYLEIESSTFFFSYFFYYILEKQRLLKKNPVLVMAVTVKNSQFQTPPITWAEI